MSGHRPEQDRAKQLAFQILIPVEMTAGNITKLKLDAFYAAAYADGLKAAAAAAISEKVEYHITGEPSDHVYNTACGHCHDAILALIEKKP